jgi:RNA polymerase sigma-70 factor (ECF subfamily)
VYNSLFYALFHFILVFLLHIIIMAIDGAKGYMPITITMSDPPGDDAARFKLTHWSQVFKVRDLNQPGAREALEQLCLDYWYPLYAFIRRRGYPRENAQDLTQAYFAHLIEKNSLQQVDPARGRFRTFLLSSLDHFLVNEWKKNSAAKRGGQCFFVSWDEMQAEKRYDQEPFSNLNAEKLYEQRWVITILERVIKTLHQESIRTEGLHIFMALCPYLTDIDNQEAYADVASRLNLTVEAVRARVGRLRKRCRELFREEVAHTVAPGELEDELRHFFSIWD